MTKSGLTEATKRESQQNNILNVLINLKAN
jgi:hypothetical protein